MQVHGLDEKAALKEIIVAILSVSVDLNIRYRLSFYSIKSYASTSVRRDSDFDPSLRGPSQCYESPEVDDG